MMMPLHVVSHSHPQRLLLHHLRWRLVLTQPPARMFHSNSCVEMLQLCRHGSSLSQTATVQQQQACLMLPQQQKTAQQQQLRALLQWRKPPCL